MKSETKNVIMATLCAILVYMVLEHFFPRQTATTAVTEKNDAVVETVHAESPHIFDLKEQNEGGFIHIQSETLQGRIRLQGLFVDQLTFLKYKQTVQKDSPDVNLLNNQYFAFPSFYSSDTNVPDMNAVWQADKTVLSPSSSVTLTWVNEQGVVFTREISLDDQYMFTVNDSVTAKESNVSVSFGGNIGRIDPQLERATSVHQGFVGVLNKKLQEEKYDTIESKHGFTYDTSDGWMGFGDKYWLSAFAFSSDNQKISTKVSFDQQSDKKVFTLSYQTPTMLVPTGKKVEYKTYFFAGPKDLDLLDAYQETLGIDRFELAIDFGWYYFLTRPFLRLLSWLYGLVGNMGIAILIFATVLRLLMLPIANKSFESMAKMRKVQPRIQELQKRYKDDKVRLNQEMLMLYKREKISPASGCLPMFIQIPVFFSLYKVLSVSIEMRQAPFLGWIHDLSMRDPSSVFTVFGLLPWPIPSMLNIGVWPVLMGVTMYLQQKMSAPVNTNNDQASDMAHAMRFMPIIFTFMMGNFASGLVIYWTWSNILGIVQQRYIIHKYEAKKS